MKNFLIHLLTIAIMIGVIIGLTFLVHKADEKTWNNGYCTECDDGKYEFVNYDFRGCAYQCNKCGHVIVTLDVME